MPSSLLAQFTQEECTPHVRQLLEEALRDPVSIGRRFEVNRFEVTVGKDILIEDVLDPESSGAQRISRDEFTAALRTSGSNPV